MWADGQPCAGWLCFPQCCLRRGPSHHNGQQKDAVCSHTTATSSWLFGVNRINQELPIPFGYRSEIIQVGGRTCEATGLHLSNSILWADGWPCAGRLCLPQSRLHRRPSQTGFLLWAIRIVNPLCPLQTAHADHIT
jgi:hypothetical protein